MKKFATGKTYKIDKEVVAPIINKYQDRRRFPFGDMQVGDSFFIPAKEQKPSAARASLGTAIRSYNLINKKEHKIATRSVEGGLRVWRIG